MTPLEYDLLIEKMDNWHSQMVKIQVDVKDPDNQIQALRLEMIHFHEQLVSGREASKSWGNK